MRKPTATLIQNILEAESFKSLRSLMLKNNLVTDSFHNYTISPPCFKDDSWKAFFYSDIKTLGTLKIEDN